MIRRLVPAALAALLASIMLGAQPASAGGGSWMDPVLDRYSPGEVATMVGYVGGAGTGWVEDGPYEVYLRQEPAESLGDGDDYRRPGEASSDITLGPLLLQETGRGGYPTLRVSITFTVPQVAPGRYSIEYGNADCTWLGDLAGGSLWVDVDPAEPITRDWPADDPARAGAAADVRLPPAPPTTQPPTTVASTTTVSTTTEAPSSSSTQVAPSTEVILTSTGSGEATDDGPASGWLLVALGGLALAVALGAGLRARRTDA